MNLNNGQAKHNLFLPFCQYGCVFLFQALESKPEVVCSSVLSCVLCSWRRQRNDVLRSKYCAQTTK